MEIVLTAAQFAELQNLVLATQDVLSQASTTSFEFIVNGTKMEYNSEEVKFELSDAE